MRSRAALPSQSAALATSTGLPPPVEKQLPNFATTGLLAKEANTVPSASSTSGRKHREVILKYHEPPEARLPPPGQSWTLFHFSAASREPVDSIPLSQRSCWLFGREASVADVPLPVDARGVSGQHAVIQFRHSVRRDEYGDRHENVKPYVIDLESKGGTGLNGERIEEGRYVELMDGDVLTFGGKDGQGEKGEEWVLMLPKDD